MGPILWSDPLGKAGRMISGRTAGQARESLPTAGQSDRSGSGNSPASNPRGYAGKYPTNCPWRLRPPPQRMKVGLRYGLSSRSDYGLRRYFQTNSTATMIDPERGKSAGIR